MSADADLHRLLAADAIERSFFQHAQQLGLHPQRHLADFVEQQAAAVGPLEAAEMALIGAGEGPFFMAEQLALRQRLGEGRTVHLDETAVPARAGLVDETAEQFLAGAAFALNQHRQVGAGDAAWPGRPVPERRAIPRSARENAQGQMSQLGVPSVAFLGRWSEDAQGHGSGRGGSQFAVVYVCGKRHEMVL